MNSLILDFNNISNELKKEVIKARKKGMMNAVRKIRNKARQLLKKALPSANKISKNYSDKLTDGVRISKYREYKDLGESVASVHVMGIRKKDSGTFRLRFFEMGAIDRHIKGHKKVSKNGIAYHVKGHSTGNIKALNFFSDAVTSELNNAPKTIEQELIKAIQKCNDR